MQKNLFYIIFVLSLSLYITGCFPASRTEEDNTQTTEETTEEKEPEVTDIEESADGAKIMSIAASEQNREMYSPQKDSTYLYWLNNRLAMLKGYTKCNIFALNVLHKSGYKTPKENTLCRDLVDTTRFKDILPVVDVSEAKKGDLVIWKHHVIIFEAMTQQVKNDLYCTAWWAGTRQKDNGENIRNNVIYGKYKLSGNFIVRRPVKK